MRGETLFDYLRRDDPVIVHVGKPSKSVTKNPQYLIPSRIEKWEEPKLGLIRRMYSDILNRIGEREVIRLRPQDRTVRNEGGVGNVVFLWNREMVVRALEETQEHLGSAEIIYMVSSHSATLCPGRTKSYLPDWATIIDAPEAPASHIQKPSIMPGDTKYSRSWSSKNIELGPCRHLVDDGELPDWFWPLAQVFTYCFNLKTRYAYIITDEELVIFRVGPCKDAPPPNGPAQPTAVSEMEKDGKMEFMTFPWRSGPHESRHEGKDGDEMSINLALWWIHLQAADNHTIQWTYASFENVSLSQPQPESSTSNETAAEAVRDSSEPAGGGENTSTPPISENEGTNTPLTVADQEDGPEYSFSNIETETIKLPSLRTKRAARNTSFVSATSAASDETELSKRASGRKRKATMNNPSGIKKGKKRGDDGTKV